MLIKKTSKLSSPDKTLKPEGFKISRADLMLASLVISLLSLALPIMTLQVYDRILPNPGSGTLPVLIFGVCLAIVLEAILRLCRASIIGRAGAAYEHQLSCEAMEHVINARLSKIGHYGVGEYLHRLASVNKLKEFYNGYALTVMIELVFVLIYLAVIIYIAAYLAIVPVTILLCFISVSYIQGRRLRTALKRREKMDDLRYNALIEMLEGIHTIKSFALENLFMRRYESLEKDSCQENFKVTQTTSRTFNTGAVFSHVMVISVISFGAVAVLDGWLTTGGLIATLLLSGRMMQPVQKALGLWARYQDYVLAKDQVMFLFNTPQKKTIAPSGEKINLPSVDGQISLKDIYFRYKNSPLLFEGLDLELKRGECILLTGAHGSGKSSLLNLMAGIYQPDEGHIVLDGHDLHEFSEDQLSEHVGYICSEGVIFRGRIRDNITCFGRISDAQAREVASLLEVDKEIAKLPGGFETVLNGTDTDSIAPGLKQRISMVRALASKPRLILFDNADRGLDSEGYALVYNLLARLKGKVTLVLVSEDKNIQSLADRTLFLQNKTLKDIPNMPGSAAPIRPYQELRL